MLMLVLNGVFQCSGNTNVTWLVKLLPPQFPKVYFDD